MQKIFFKEELEEKTDFQPEPAAESNSSESFQDGSDSPTEEQSKESQTGTSAA
jgi:hypothetical protein